MSDSNIQATPPPTQVPAADESIPVPSQGEVPPVRDVPPRWFAGFDGILMVMVLALTFFLGAFQATNSDLYQNLAVGKQIAEGEWAAGADPFLVVTEARDGRPAAYWANHSWASSWLFYLLYTLVSPQALVALKALLLVVLAACLTTIRAAGSSLPTALFFVGLGLLAASPRFLMQTTVFSFLLFGLYLVVLHRTGLLGGIEAARARPRLLWALPILMVLWVNLDGWFVAGLLLVWLTWAGVGLGRLLGRPAPVPGWTVGAAALATTAACLASPHHVHVFVLPPELATTLLGVTDSLGIGLPESVMAGGKSLRSLQELDPTIAAGSALVSPLSSAYWSTSLTGYGGNLAGMAYVPLLILSFLTFALVAWSSNQPEAPQPDGVRLLLWLVFGLMSMFQARLVPWFALVAGPILTLNLGEWLAWRRSVNSLRVPDWRVGRLARLLLFLLLAVGLALGWPGWLHSPSGDPYAGRRVSLDVYEDGSLRDLSRRIPPDARVFNMTSDVANYLAWFGPKGCKAFVDFRYQLFPEQAAVYARARKSLLQENEGRVAWAMALAASAPAADERSLWREVFRDHRLNHLAAGNFRRDPRTQILARGLWLLPGRWPMIYGDGTSVGFVWEKEGPGSPEDALVDAWSARAWGPAARPLPSRAVLPPGERDPFDTYLHGRPYSPREIGEAALYLTYAQQVGQVWPRYYIPTWFVSSWTGVASNGLPLGLGIPFSAIMAEGLPARVFQQPFPMPRSRRPMLHATDPPVPAAPVLMVRALRRGLQENLGEPACYGLLAQAYRFLWLNQEEYWANYSDLDSPNLRFLEPYKLQATDEFVSQEFPKADPLERQAIVLNILRLHAERESPQWRTHLRQVQIAHGLRSSLLQDPDNPQLHLEMASFLLDMHFLDLGLEHLKQALVLLPPPGPDPAGQQAAKQRKLVQAQTERVEELLRKPLRDFPLEAGKVEGIGKAMVAWRAPYKTIDSVTNRERYDFRGMGLAGEALKQFEKIKPDSLGDQEKAELVYWQLRLLLATGKTKEIAGSDLENLRPLLGPQRFPEIQYLYAGAVGDFDGVEAALAELTEQFQRATVAQPFAASLSQGLSMSNLPQAPLLPRAVLFHMQSRTYLENAGILGDSLRRIGELLVLRGLNALEQGDTDKAADFFRQAVRRVGPDVYCPDLLIARRYLALREAAGN